MEPKKFFAAVLVVIGALTVLLSGGCTLFMAFGLVQADTFEATLIPMMLIFGGLPFLVGLLFFIIGLRLHADKK